MGVDTGLKGIFVAPITCEATAVGVLFPFRQTLTSEVEEDAWSPGGRKRNPMGTGKVDAEKSETVSLMSQDSREETFCRLKCYKNIPTAVKATLFHCKYLRHFLFRPICRAQIQAGSTRRTWQEVPVINTPFFLFGINFRSADTVTALLPSRLQLPWVLLHHTGRESSCSTMPPCMSFSPSFVLFSSGWHFPQKKFHSFSKLQRSSDLFLSNVFSIWSRKFCEHVPFGIFSAAVGLVFPSYIFMLNWSFPFWRFFFYLQFSTENTVNHFERVSSLLSGSVHSCQWSALSPLERSSTGGIQIFFHTIPFRF